MPYNPDLERSIPIADSETDAFIEAPEQVLRELNPAARTRIQAGLLEIDAIGVGMTKTSQIGPTIIGVPTT